MKTASRPAALVMIFRGAKAIPAPATPSATVSPTETTEQAIEMNRMAVYTVSLFRLTHSQKNDFSGFNLNYLYSPNLK